MNLKETREIIREIGQISDVRVTGVRRYGRGSYAVDCVYIHTGDSLVINSHGEWRERMAMGDERVT